MSIFLDCDPTHHAIHISNPDKLFAVAPTSQAVSHPLAQLNRIAMRSNPSNPSNLSDLLNSLKNAIRSRCIYCVLL
ncbi:hypothetical protein N657DRAFT_639006 [Parathielavia appendiculata]|uniref:Uncharacterized protein n=1 Tax=Parathielavia appendiculata TaxID=2587402 RepID=A0AAN6U9K4_9PEZI|nr:hypothetical protein N657DRAFT_639006 [Parathielavia appendiculata]